MSCFALLRSLSSAIDPGITFRPCIALTTEERSRMFSRRYLAEKCKKVQLCSEMTSFVTVRLTSLFVSLLWWHQIFSNTLPKLSSLIYHKDKWILFTLAVTHNACRRKLLSLVLLFRARLCNVSKESFSLFQWAGMWLDADGFVSAVSGHSQTENAHFISLSSLCRRNEAPNQHSITEWYFTLRLKHACIWCLILQAVVCYFALY